MDTDKILEKLGLKYEDLNNIEKETLNNWMESLQKNQLSVETLKSYILSMRDSVENELTKAENGSKQDIFLKARLRNYMLLEAFLTSPEKAKAALERSLSGMVKNKKI